MYNLHLSPEQLEIRDTVRDFVTREIKPAALKADRLDAGDRSPLTAQIKAASRLGLRALLVSEARGGSGADALTACIVVEELAAGDADVAATLAETARLAPLLFERAMSDAQRRQFLPGFLADDNYHLAFAARELATDTRLGVNYHRPAPVQPALQTAVKASGGELIVSGLKTCIANAPFAALFAVLAAMPGRAAPGVLLVPATAAGLTVRVHDKIWQHGAYGDVSFEGCRVPAANLLGEEAAASLTAADASGGNPLAQALNLGIGRAAYEAALDYARLRVQGSRPIIEHQAIATKLAEIAIKLEVARAAVWQAAWASDHPEAIADHSLSGLPLQNVAQVFTSEMMLAAAKDAAEVFGAMGVMRDMPLQKYVHDARVCLHSGDGNADVKLRIAEAIAGYRHAGNRTPAAADA